MSKQATEGVKLRKNEQQNRVNCFVHSCLNLPATNQIVAGCVNTSLVYLKFRDHNTFLGNYSPTPPLNQHFTLREKQERKVSVGVGLREG